MYLQFKKENSHIDLSIPPVRLGDKEEVTYKATTTALRKAVRLNRAIQAPDGHWAAENAGPMFFTPPLVSLLLNSKLRTTCLFYEFRYQFSFYFIFLLI